MAQSQQVGDLVVNLDVNTSKFTEQVVYAERQLSGLSKQTDSTTKKMNDDFSNLGKASLQGLLGSIDPIIKSMGRLDEQRALLVAHFEAGRLSGDQFQHFNQILEQTRVKLLDTGEAAQQAAAKMAFAKEAEAQSRALKGLLGSIDPTIRAVDALDEQYSQLVAHFEAGRLSGSQFQHFSKMIDDARVKISSTEKILPEALSAQELAAKKAGISVGQYTNALRMIPMQFTDIATQLAGGQNPLLILLQQGGQIKDQFGGIRGALSGTGSYLKSLAGFITPVTVGVTALGAAVVSLGAAWYQGEKEQSEFNKQLILTGGYSGKTAGQLSQLSSEIGKETGSIADAAETIAKVTGTGLFKGDALEKVSRTAIEMQKSTGQAVDQTIAQFKRLQEDPVKASEELNSQYHYLTASIYDQIAALERQGDVTGAARLATDSYADAMKTRTAQLTQNLGTIETLWLNIKNAAASAWDRMLDIGREKTLEEKISDLRKRINEEKDLAKTGIAQSSFGQGYALTPGGEERIKKMHESAAGNLQSQLKLLEQATGLNQDIAAAKAKAREDTEKDIKASERHNANLAQYESNAIKRARELKQLEADRAKYSAADFAMVKKGIEDKYADKKQPAIKTPGGVKALDTASANTLELQTQLKVLQQHTGLNDKISSQRKDLWATEAKFSVLEEESKKRQLSTEEQSLLNNKDQILAEKKKTAELGDQITAQEQINKLLDDSTRYVNQMAEKTQALAVGAGTSTREARRLMEQAQLRQGWMNKGGKLSDTGFQRELGALQNYYNEEDKMRSDWQAGALRSLQDYADEATNYYKIAADSMNSILGGATNAIAQGMSDIVTGAKSVGQGFSEMFSNLGQLVIQTLMKMAAQWIVYKTVQLAIGKTTSAQSASIMSSSAQSSALMAQLNAYSSTAAIPIIGPAKAPAAMAAAAAITEPLAAAISALSLAGMAHDGIDKIPATGTWLLQKGERVMTSGTSKRLDSAIADMRNTRSLMMSRVEIPQVIHVNGNPDDRTMTMLQQAVKQGAQQGYNMVVSDLARGDGKASKVMQSLYTTKRKVR